MRLGTCWYIQETLTQNTFFTVVNTSNKLKIDEAFAEHIKLQ